MCIKCRELQRQRSSERFLSLSCAEIKSSSSKQRQNNDLLSRRERVSFGKWEKRRVVIGGGIAGTKCAIELARASDLSGSGDLVVLIERSQFVKVFNDNNGDDDEDDFVIDKVEIKGIETSTDVGLSKVEIVKGEVVGIDVQEMIVEVLCDGGDLRSVKFDQVCFAVGAKPKALSSFDDEGGKATERVLVGEESNAEKKKKKEEMEEKISVVKYVRDTESADVLVEALRRAFSKKSDFEPDEVNVAEQQRERVEPHNKKVKREKGSSSDNSSSSTKSTTTIVVTGNGAVALEIINALDESFLQLALIAAKCAQNNNKELKRSIKILKALRKVNVVWVVKHEAIGDALFDRDASAFLLEHRQMRRKIVQRKVRKTFANAKREESCIRRHSNNNRIEEEEEENKKTKKKITVINKEFSFDEKISFPRRRGAFGASVAAKTSSAGPDWFKRVNATLTNLFASDDFSSDDDDEKGNNDCDELDRGLIDEIINDDDNNNDWLTVETKCEIKDILENESKSIVTLTNGKTIENVLVVAACIGVEPRGSTFLDEEQFGFIKNSSSNNNNNSNKNVPNEEEEEPEGFITDGILVDDTFELARAPKPNVFYAVGDCCLCDSRNKDPTTNWFQMRSWSQAAQSGAQCARSMLKLDGYEFGYGFNFELFAHSTTFFGLKVILLGSFNLQKFPNVEEKDVQILSRKSVLTDDDDDDDVVSVDDDEDEDDEDFLLAQKSTFIRCVTYKGKVVGACLIGETNLEETFENLIQDKIDVSHLGAELLDPDIDIEDFFD
jgi:hypothetical protein